MNSKPIFINLTNLHIPLDKFFYVNSTRIAKICNASLLSLIHLAKNTKDKKCLLVLLAQLGQKNERFVDKVTTQSQFTFKIMVLHGQYEGLHNFSVVLENDCPCVGCLCKSLCNL